MAPKPNSDSLSRRNEAARLLSGVDEPSVYEKEAVERAVLDHDSVRGSVRKPWWVWSGLSIAAGTGALAVFLMATPAPEFTAKGPGDEGPSFQVECDGPSCSTGETLMFVVSSGELGRHFSSFSRRSDGTIIWYFPSESVPQGLRLGSEQVLRRGIELGAEHPPGAYEVYGLFSDGPLTREQIAAFFEGAGSLDKKPEPRLPRGVDFGRVEFEVEP